MCDRESCKVLEPNEDIKKLQRIAEEFEEVLESIINETMELL